MLATTAVSSGPEAMTPSSEAGPSYENSAVVESEVVVAVLEDQPLPQAAMVVEANECVICLGELEDPATTDTLICGHAFHAACVSEWLSKDGRCPTCRRQIREVVVQQVPMPSGLGGLGGLGLPDMASRASMHSMAILMLESRRLMMLATMEAALAVLVMSYVSDLLSPALMILAAGVTFIGASHYLSKSIAAARPILAINGFYHIYLMVNIVIGHQGTPFFSDEYGSARTVLLSLGCVTIMEFAALKKAAAFHMRLARAPPIELRTLRSSRRAHVGWAQRLIVLVMFVLICAPVVARYVCGAGRGESGRSSMCE